MKTRSQLLGAIAAMLLIALVMALGPAIAQDEPEVLPVSVLSLQFTAVGVEPPTIEEAPDTFIFKINPVGTVSGAIEGDFLQRITQVHPAVADVANAVNRHIDITTFFTIETDEGTIEGYYSGPFYFPADTHPDAVSRQNGHILSVTAAYADLFLAEVFYDGIVDFEEVDGMMVGIGDSGTLTIVPRVQ